MVKLPVSLVRGVSYIQENLYVYSPGALRKVLVHGVEDVNVDGSSLPVLEISEAEIIFVGKDGRQLNFNDIATMNVTIRTDITASVTKAYADAKLARDMAVNKSSDGQK